MTQNFCFGTNRLAAAGRTLSAACFFAALAARADTNVVTVRALTLTNQFTAYAQVEPIAALPLRAAQAGIVAHLDVLPGATVRAGEKLAELRGPEIRALLAQAQADANAAKTGLRAARESLSIVRQQRASRLSTRQMVAQAEGAAAQAQAAFDTAQGRFRSLRRLITVTAPVAGTVLRLNAADGERVAAGQPILTLAPANRLWLKAEFFGADVAAIHAGMSGEFNPASGGKVIPVNVSAVFGALAPDGGESAGLAAGPPAPGWLNGEFGTVTLNGARRALPVVPTQALVLDRGRWWVLVHTESGDQPRTVTPGPSRGWQTFIESGLTPGQQVVVENAYLEFHRSISKTYQPPD